MATDCHQARKAENVTRRASLVAPVLASAHGERDRDPGPAPGPRPVRSDGRRPQEWRILEELDAATTDAIVFAVARGWVVVQAGHSICMTDAGRRLVESR